VDHFAVIGGIPLLAVFERPKTVALKWGKDGQVTEWNPAFAGVALRIQAPEFPEPTRGSRFSFSAL
jgi:hypothetical protein